MGLLLSFSTLPSKSVRGGQEHDLFHDTATDRYYFKVTRNGVFLDFIAETLAAGHSLHAVRTVTTHP